MATVTYDVVHDDGKYRVVRLECRVCLAYAYAASDERFIQFVDSHLHRVPPTAPDRHELVSDLDDLAEADELADLDRRGRDDGHGWGGDG